MTLRRTTLSLDRQIVARRYAHGNWALCLTCGRPVDSEELVEGYPGESVTCEVLVKHHGAEELRTFEFGSTNWDENDLGKYMHSADFFDPRKVVSEEAPILTGDAPK